MLAAIERGYATFNISRIGIGSSDKPPGRSVDVSVNSYVLHQIIGVLKDKSIIGIDFGKAITVGHSMGSVMTIDHAVKYPGDVDAVVLTGILHNTNPAYTDSARSSSKLAMLDPKFAFRLWDMFYFTSKPGMRQDMFYFLPNADPAVIAVDEETRQTLTLGEIISISQYDRSLTSHINVPVLMVNGDRDFTSCGGEIDCGEYNEALEYEQQFFNTNAEFELVLLEQTGHVINLHKNAPQSFEIILNWLDRKIKGM